MKKIILTLNFALGTSLLFAQFDNAHVVKTKFNRAAADDKLITLLAYDVDNDGKMDLLMDGGMIAPQSGMMRECSKVVFLKGDNAGGFAQGDYINKPGTLHAISDIRDYNGDGFGDLLMLSFFENGFKIFNGTANGTFPSNVFMPTSTHGTPAYYLDYDNDGDLDILTQSAGSAAVIGLHVFTNNNGTFTHTSYFAPDGANTIAMNFSIADVTGDGLQDVVCLSAPKAYFYFIQQPDHSFAYFRNSTDNTTNFFSHQIYYRSYVDVNQDGKSDLINMDQLSGKLAVSYSNGTGACFDFNTDELAPQFEDCYISRSGRGYESDFDHDGATDFIYLSGPLSPNFLYVIYDPFNTKGHRKYEKLLFANGNRVAEDRGVTIADFNKDGNNDIAVITRDDTLKVFLNQLPPVTTGIHTNDISNTKLTCYPNPASDRLHFEYSSNIAHPDLNIKMMDVSGKVIKAWKETRKSWDISTKTFARGLYFFNISDKYGNNSVAKVVLN